MDPSLYITPEEYEIAEKNGIPRRNLNVRVRELFWDKERAITHPLQKVGNPTPWSKWKKECQENGISYKTFYSRINEYGWTPKDAATLPKQDQAAKLATFRESNKVLTDEVLEVMKKHNLKKNTVHTRLWNGWTLEKAITTPVKRVGRAVLKKSV